MVQQFVGEKHTDGYLVHTGRMVVRRLLANGSTKQVTLPDDFPGGGGAPGGAAGGALSGTYPNPTLATNSVSTGNIVDGTIAAGDLAAGVAASNVGTLSGVLGGTLPSPTMAAGAAATNVGTLGGSLAGTLPNPTLAANSVGASQITDGSVGNAELSIQIPRQNLLVNGGFEIWQRGVGPFAGNVYSADRWFTATPGTGSSYSSSVTRAAGGNQDVPSNFCWTCTYTHAVGNNSIVYQKVEDVLWSWRPLCFTLRVKCTVASGIRAWISGDGGTTKIYSSYHTGGGVYETLTCQFQNNHTALLVGWEFSATGTYYVDNAMLVIGQSPGGEWEALHPADEQMRCQRYYEIIGETATSFQINAYGTAGGVIQSWLPYKTRKAVTPTLTKVGTWATANAGQPALAFPGFDGCALQVTATALGMAAVANNTTGNSVTVEANP